MAQDIEIVVEDPTAPDENSPAVTSTRTVELVVMTLLLALAVLLGWDNWRTGASWDDTGPQAGYFPFYLSIILGGAALFGFVSVAVKRTEGRETFVTRAQLGRVLQVFVPTLLFCLDAVARPLRGELPADRGVHGHHRQDRMVEVAAHGIHLCCDHVRRFRCRLRRHHAEGAARSGLRTIGRAGDTIMEAFGLCFTASRFSSPGRSSR
jgi:hypothetical protein